MPRAHAHLEGHENRFALGAEPQAVVPVGVQPAGQPVGPATLEVELDGLPQVAQHRGLPVVGVGQRFLVERQVARLLDVGVHGVEKPEAVVGAVGRFVGRLLAARPVVKGLTSGIAPP